jgi:hypothetical protein
MRALARESGSCAWRAFAAPRFMPRAARVHRDERRASAGRRAGARAAAPAPAGARRKKRRKKAGFPLGAAADLAYIAAA